MHYAGKWSCLKGCKTTVVSSLVQWFPTFDLWCTSKKSFQRPPHMQTAITDKYTRKNTRYKYTSKEFQRRLYTQVLHDKNAMIKEKGMRTTALLLLLPECSYSRHKWTQNIIGKHMMEWSKQHFWNNHKAKYYIYWTIDAFIFNNVYYFFFIVNCLFQEKIPCTAVTTVASENNITVCQTWHKVIIPTMVICWNIYFHKVESSIIYNHIWYAIFLCKLPNMMKCTLQSSLEITVMPRPMTDCKWS